MELNVVQIISEQGCHNRWQRYLKDKEHQDVEYPYEARVPWLNSSALDYFIEWSGCSQSRNSITIYHNIGSFGSHKNHTAANNKPEHN